MSQLARRWPWSTGDRVYNTWSVATLAQAVKRDIGSESRILPTTPAFDAPFRRGGGSRRRIIPISFGMKKTRMVWLPDGEKISKISICFDRMYQRDRQKDRQTDGHRMTAKAALA